MIKIKITVLITKNLCKWFSNQRIKVIRKRMIQIMNKKNRK